MKLKCEHYDNCKTRVDKGLKGCMGKTYVSTVQSSSLLDDPLGYLFEVRGGQKVFIVEDDPHKAIDGRQVNDTHQLACSKSKSNRGIGGKFPPMT